MRTDNPEKELEPRLLQKATVGAFVFRQSKRRKDDCQLEYIIIWEGRGIERQNKKKRGREEAGRLQDMGAGGSKDNTRQKERRGEEEEEEK
jgi:hypothetical protein